MARKRETGRPALECEVVALDTIRPHPDNARIHPEENVEALASSLEAFGQVEPLVVQRSTRYVLGGNGRLQAMRRLGWHQCSVHWVDMDDVRAASLSVALNRTAELAKWDDAVLARLLERFRTAAPEAGAPIVGFTEEQVNRVLTRFSPRQESGAGGEPSTVPVSQPVGQSGRRRPGPHNGTWAHFVARAHVPVVPGHGNLSRLPGLYREIASILWYGQRDHDSGGSAAPRARTDRLTVEEAFTAWWPGRQT
jgi:hypothetical protein